MSLVSVLKEQSLEEIKNFVSRDPVMMRGKDPEGTPFSYHLVRRGDFAAVRWLVEYSRADMNERDLRGRNILFPAIESSSLALCRYFCERVGIDPLEADNYLLTPLEYAARRAEETGDKSSREIFSYLEKRSGLLFGNTYKNPVRRGFSPDPSPVRVGEDYYMVNSSFLAFPALPISHSKDLVNWKTIGHAVSWDNPVDLSDFDPGRGFWAADISWHEGVFYVIATLRYNDSHQPMRRQMVVSSRDPAGPWSAPRFLEEDGIDPSIFRDKGRTYVLLNRGNRIFEVDEKVTKRLGESSLLYYGDTRKATEAPHLIKHNDYYYLFMAEGGTGPGHQINVARAEKLEGPYTPCPYNPLMSRAGREGTIQRTGHGKPIQTQNGEWYIAYLGSRQYEKGFSALGRETFLDKLEWTAEGWPLINGNKGPSALAERPLPEHKPEADEAERGFGRDSLAKDCYFIRNVSKDDFAVKDGVLELKASPKWPDAPKASPILLRRQEEAFTEISLQLCLDDLEIGDRAGLILYYDENSWYFWAAGRTEESFRAELWKNAGSGRVLLAARNITALEASAETKEEKWLSLEADISWPHYAFACRAGEEKLFGAEDEGKHLTDEGLKIGKRFTGAGAGAFAAGKGRVRFRKYSENPKPLHERAEA